MMTPAARSPKNISRLYSRMTRRIGSSGSRASAAARRVSPDHALGDAAGSAPSVPGTGLDGGRPTTAGSCSWTELPPPASGMTCRRGARSLAMRVFGGPGPTRVERLRHVFFQFLPHTIYELARHFLVSKKHRLRTSGHTPNTKPHCKRVANEEQLRVSARPRWPPRAASPGIGASGRSRP